MPLHSIRSMSLADTPTQWPARRNYAWLVFVLTAGLLFSDYMSRQVLTAVFPMLKADWRLSDTQLGSLVSVVAVMVGIFTVPLSLAADMVGRVRSIVAMALLWNLATLACGVATGYEQMFVARLIIGVGAAAFGSVGAAVLMSVFPPTMRSTINGSFLAGSIFGSVLGLALGGALAARFGWRAAFVAMALFGISLALAYPLVVSGRSASPGIDNRQWKSQLPNRAGLARIVRELSAVPSLLFALVGGGLQLFVLGAFITWMPSFLGRAYAMSAHQSALVGSGFVMIAGVGMVVCSVAADRASHAKPGNKLTISAGYCLITATLLVIAFSLPRSTGQLGAFAGALFFSGGATGPAAAVGADLSRASIHATVMALAALANNLFGLAPGPLIVGIVADHSSLVTALSVTPAVSLVAFVAFGMSYRHYNRDVARLAP